MNIASKSPVPIRIEEPVPAAFANRPGVFKPSAFTISALDTATGRETVTRNVDARVWLKWSTANEGHDALADLREVDDDEADALTAALDAPMEPPAAAAPATPEPEPAPSA